LRVKLSGLENACRNLELAGILTADGKQLRFTVPLFGRMLDENFPVEYALQKAIEEYQTSTAVP
jgi:hypothetical protein